MASENAPRQGNLDRLRELGFPEAFIRDAQRRTETSLPGVQPDPELVRAIVERSRAKLAEAEARDPSPACLDWLRILAGYMPSLATARLSAASFLIVSLLGWGMVGLQVRQTARLED